MESALKRDRAIVASGLLILTLLAWIYTVREAASMETINGAVEAGAGMAMPSMQPWSAVDATWVFLMWNVMMVAMMIPSAAPMVLLFAAVNRKRREQERPFVPTGLFLLGYLFAWSSFSALATVAQWGLHSAALLSEMMVSTSVWLGGAALIAAGAFQWTTFKHACLDHCRSPLSFLATHWRDGAHGAFETGLHHGAYCVGCCWLLMCLLFVTGVMNLVWVAMLSAFVLAEKAAPRALAPWVSRMAGFFLLAWGGWMISTAFPLLG
ncbi:MAG: DUF2182 domain-containing protein [Acidobacteriota bacterium]